MYVLIAAAIIPAIFLLIQVYRADKLEPEPPRLVLGLVFLGMVSTLLASLTEQLGQAALINVPYDTASPSATILRRFVLYFIVVGLSEEGFKYLLLYRRTWRSPEFNCQFDAVVYAVSVSLGFALWENILYVLHYGLSVAIVRAITAVPGHASFGVFMGVWYGIAKRCAMAGDEYSSRRARTMALVIPTLLHGCYDYIATMTSQYYSLIFLAFVVMMFLLAARLVRKYARGDSYLDGDADSDIDSYLHDNTDSGSADPFA